MVLASSPVPSSRAGRRGGRDRAGGSLAAALLVACALPACSTRPSTEQAAAGPAPAPAPAGPPPPFLEAGADVGLDFVHRSGATGEFYPPEIMGPGVALLDIDGDGDLDLFLVEGGVLDPAARPGPPGGRLYRNDLARDPSGASRLHFTDVSAAAGVAGTGYGQGVASGDYDNDGRPDLYITGFGHNRLLRNRGDGSFEDVTARSGTDDERWSVPALFLDHDRDGRLDLWVGNYLDFRFSNHTVCRDVTGAQDYCSPTVFPGVPDRLLRNRGDGTFEDRTHASGIDARYGAALGGVAADFDGDGWPDLYVSNDRTPNQLWINQRDGTFRDRAVMAGAAVNAHGMSEASMGTDAGDYDGDGDLDLFIVNLTGETNTLYRNDGRGGFDDVTQASGLGPPSLPFTGFGTGWIDWDRDGWLDLLVVNGTVRTIEELRRRGDPFPFHQSSQLFRNRGDGTFADVTARGGAPLARSTVSRGLAFGDLDNDGDTDAVVAVDGGPARILVNQAAEQGRAGTAPATGWVGLRLLDRSGRDALGALLTLKRRAGAPLVRHVHSDGSYASASDPRVLVGLGSPGGADSPLAGVIVSWPTGERERFPPPPLDAYTTLRQGSGAPP